MKTKVLTIQLLVMFLASILIAQDSKSIKEKLEKVKGEANKIVITTDNGDVVFEGEEAKALLKLMKPKKIHKRLKWVSEDGENISIDGEDVLIFNSKGDKKHILKHKGKGDKMMMFISDDDDIDIIDGKKTIKVKVEDENGEKEVTVTTKEDGEEKVEKYKGKEADEYLEKMKEEHNVLIDIDMDSEGDHVWIHKEDFDHKDIEKKVEVKIEDGVKKVTIKTTKDGNETVETYEGEEADKFLEDMHDDEHKVIVKEHMKDGKKYKKVIIKEFEKEEE